MHYDSRCADKWGANVDVWTHLIFYRASRNLHQLVADGHDPMELLTSRAHAAGLWFFPTLPLCIVGQPDRSNHSIGRTSDFAYTERFYVGPEEDPQPAKLTRMFSECRLDFLVPEVRAERAAIYAELLSRYETDGVEVDLSLDNEFGPLTKLSRCRTELAPVLTEWLRELRKVADAAQAEQGRRKRVYVRIPASEPETWAMLGMEVEKWVAEGIVDGLVSCATLWPRPIRKH